MQSFNIPANETPEQAATRKRQAVAQALMSPPQTIGGGLQSLGMAIGNRMQQNPTSQFPQAPGGAQPSLGMQLSNFFTGRQNGGLM